MLLSPEKLLGHQKYPKEQTGSGLEKPIFLVMHGGSGSTDAEIKEAVDNGVIKMNIDTNTQWAYWNGVRNFVAEKHDYLQYQIGNPDGDDVPNKKYYDPRVWIRKGEVSMIDRLCISMTQLNSKDMYKRSQEPGVHQCLPFKKPVQTAASIETTA